MDFKALLEEFKDILSVVIFDSEGTFIEKAERKNLPEEFEELAFHLSKFIDNVSEVLEDLKEELSEVFFSTKELVVIVRKLADERFLMVVSKRGAETGRIRFKISQI